MLVYRVEHPIFGGPFRGNGDGPPAHMTEHDYDRMAELSKHRPDCYLPPSPFVDIEDTFGPGGMKIFHRFIGRAMRISFVTPDDLIWGFSNRAQLDRWFPKPCIDILQRYDFTEAVYKVPDESCLILNQQAGWFRQHGELVNRQTL